MGAIAIFQVLLLIAVAAIFLFGRRGSRGRAKPGIASDDFFGGRSLLDGGGFSGVGTRLIGMVVLLGLGALGIGAVSELYRQYELSQIASYDSPVDGGGTSSISTIPDSGGTIAEAPPTVIAPSVVEPLTADAGEIPADFNYPYGQAALRGEAGAIDRSMTWSNSAQGDAFWRSENDTVNAGGQMTDRARGILQAWVLAAETEAGSLPSGFIADWANAALRNEPSAISLAFDWTSTVQGYDFWRAENDSVAAGGYPSAKAMRILRTWLALNGTPAL
jgi:hypothetical protein